MRTPLVVAVLLAFGASAGSASQTILHPRHEPAASLLGIHSAPAFDVDAGALSALRKSPRTRLDDFPLGARRTALELERFDPIANTRFELAGPTGTRPASKPDLAFFRGHAADEPSSIAIVTASATTLRALVIREDGVTVVGPDADGTHRSWSLADVDASTWPTPTAFCMNDLADLARPSALREALTGSASPRTGDTHLGFRHAQIAVETDRELRLKFGSDDEALAYVATLFAQASVIYERDLEIALDVSYLRIWSGSDPWTSSSPDGQLGELRSYWNNPANDMASKAGARDAVHMLSGKPVLGGIAYVDAMCDQAYGYGVSQVYGGFDVSNPYDTWDLVVVMHELGHNFGTEHTHCYDPPIDTCFSGEPGCYIGPETASQGTIMSYCHLHSGGLSNIDLRFHARVIDRLHTTTSFQGCLEAEVNSPCGDGTLDPGEECDDGGRISGDGCSSQCRIEVCGNGTRDAGEGCDDGNLDGGDGCSATCRTERCALFSPLQSQWTSSRLLVKPGGAGAGSVSLRAAFEIPSTALVDVATAGIEVVGEKASGALGLSLTVPGGPGWKTRGTRLRYRGTGEGTDGVKKVVVTTKSRGDRSRVKVVVVGKGDGYPETVEDLPARLTIVLGGAEAGASGACGEWEPRLGSCRSERGGKRLACR